MSTRYKGFKSVPLTQELATEFATMETFAGERPRKPKRLKFLNARLENNQFYSPRWAVAWLDGRKIRVNGQHSSIVLANANGRFPKNLQVIIDEFECDTDQDLAELFAQFDSRESGRSDGDMVGAHAKVHSEFTNVNNTYIDRLVRGIAFHVTGGYADGHPTSEERARLIHNNRDFVRQYWEMAKPRWIAGRLGAHAAMFASYTSNKSEAFTFWNLVATEAHPDPEHPTRKLRKWLDSIVVEGRSKSGRTDEWTPRAVYVKCLRAWNAFRTGQPTDLRYHKKSPLPVAA